MSVRQIGRVGAPSPFLACHRAGSRIKPTSDESRKPTRGNPLLKHALRQSDGKPARFVVLAGENGSGKTVILESIFAALAPTSLLLNTPRKLTEGRYRVLVEPDAPNTSSRFSRPIPPEVFGELRERWPDFSGIVVEVDGRKIGANEPFHNYYRLYDNTATTGNQNSMEVLEVSFACFYSEANVSFDVPEIRSIAASVSPRQQSHLPANIEFPLRGGQALANEIAQLLVDLQAADDAEVGRWLDDNEGRPPDALRNRRTKGFAEAFARIFPRKRYLGTEVVEGEHRAIFEEDGFRTPLAHLSTGEKQIVFRGAFLLRRAENLPGAVVLIDEPELSLHPTWQASVLPFYEGIVSQTAEKTSQIVFATHSPFVVHGSPTAKHIVLRRDRQARRVLVDAEPTYPGTTAADVAVAAFDLGGFASELTGKRLAVVVEGPTDKAILEAGWLKLRPGRNLPFVILPAGGARVVQQLLGSEPRKAGPLLTAISNAGTRHVVGVFDFDAEGYGHWNGAIKRDDAELSSDDVRSCIYRKRVGASVWAALLPVPAHRSAYAGLESGIAKRSILTIELLFPDEYVAGLLGSLPIVGAPGRFVPFPQTEAQKRAVAQAARNFPPEAFKDFEAIFALLERVLASH